MNERAEKQTEEREVSGLRGERRRASQKARTPISCFDRAVRILALRDHSRADLRRKLAAAGHEDADIENAFARLESLGYLDDERFAAQYARQLSESGKVGRMAAVRKLCSAGIGRSDAESAVSLAFGGVDEFSLAEALIRRRFPEVSAGTLDAKSKARAARFLAGRGFSSSVISRVLKADFGAFDS